MTSACSPSSANSAGTLNRITVRRWPPRGPATSIVCACSGTSPTDVGQISTSGGIRRGRAAQSHLPRQLASDGEARGWVV